MPTIRKGWLHEGVALGSEELGAGLVETLERAGFGADELKDLTSHSLKATWLTYLGKYGTPREARQLLGFRLAKGEESSLNYNRDNLADPMRLMNKVIKKVRSGAFNPDAPRGRMHVKDLDARQDAVSRALEHLAVTKGALAGKFAGTLTEVETDVCNAAGGGIGNPDDDADNGIVNTGEEFETNCEWMLEDGAFDEGHDSGASRDGDHDDSDDDELEHVPEKEFENVDEDAVALEIAAAVFEQEGSLPKVKSECADAKCVLRHRIRQTVHLGRAGCEVRLACGRGRTEVYEVVQPEVGVPWPRCSDCFLV